MTTGMSIIPTIHANKWRVICYICEKPQEKKYFRSTEWYENNYLQISFSFLCLLEILQPGLYAAAQEHSVQLPPGISNRCHSEQFPQLLQRL